jgi:ribosomal-protein-alanine N-acetyltransferase
VDPETIFSGPFPQLRTPRLRLRELRDDDADGILALFGDPEATRYYDLETFTQRQEAVELVRRWRQRWERRIGMRWVLCRADAPGELLGTCGYNLWWPEAARGVLGFDLRRACWRQGLMREALDAVLDYGFARLGLQRVEALVFDGNDASRQLLLRLGFTLEGTLRDYQRLHGAFHDMHIFSLLRHERGSTTAEPGP